MTAHKRLLLVGGGHAHVEVLRRFALRRPPGTSLLLISPARHTPYSGMLPGLLAGHYTWRDCHIDLQQLCDAAGATLLTRRAIAIDASGQGVTCDDLTRHSFDLLSLDVGSTPAISTVTGAQDLGIRVKPVDEFLARMELLAVRAQQQPGLRILVVGAGAAGVEIALGLAYRLRTERASVGLLTGNGDVLPNAGAWARSLIRRALRRAGVTVRRSGNVTGVDAQGVRLGNGERLQADEVVWATGAAAPGWLRDSGLDLTSEGFVEVGPFLQSTSHPMVFAAGDVATMRGRAHPKSGVYAVRQGPHLAENLRRALAGTPLLTYSPQRHALALLATGPRHAIALWGSLAWSGDWVWRWKDRIDRGFMARYPAPN